MANAAQHRQHIVQTAIRLFREKGYAATGLNEILNSSNAPKGSLYYYFPRGKEQLAEEAVLQAGNQVAGTLQQLANQAAVPEEFIRAYCELLAGWMESAGYKAGCPITTTLLETVPASAALTKACQQVFVQWHRIISEVFTRAGCDKQTADVRGELVISAIEGALIQSRLHSSSRPLLQVPQLFIE